MDPHTLHLAAELDRLAATRDDAWQITPDQGRFLYQLALASGGRLVEVGTSYGFSGLYLGAAAKVLGGHLHTIDVNPDKVEAARRVFRAAGLQDHITCHLGSALDVLPTLPGPHDLVFIDADKAPTQQYVDLAWARLRVGGSVVNDNTHTHPEALGAFVAGVRARDDASSADVPLGNGMEWTVRVR